MRYFMFMSEAQKWCFHKLRCSRASRRSVRASTQNIILFLLSKQHSVYILLGMFHCIQNSIPTHTCMFVCQGSRLNCSENLLKGEGVQSIQRQAISLAEQHTSASQKKTLFLLQRTTANPT